MNGVTSGWCPVTSGVLWGSILSLVLFDIFINNLDAELEIKSRGDSALGDAVVSLEGRKTLQRDLNKIERWSVTNCVNLTRSGAGFSTCDGAALDACIDQGVRGWRAVL